MMSCSSQRSATRVPLSSDSSIFSIRRGVLLPHLSFDIRREVPAQTNPNAPTGEGGAHDGKSIIVAGGCTPRAENKFLA